MFALLTGTWAGADLGSTSDRLRSYIVVALPPKPPRLDWQRIYSGSIWVPYKYAYLEWDSSLGPHSLSLLEFE